MTILILFLFLGLFFIFAGYIVGVKMVLVMFSFLIFSIIAMLIRRNILEKNALKDSSNLDFDYIRDIPKQLDLVDILFLDNKNFKTKEPIKLIIISLYLKGYIDIKQENKKISIHKVDKLFNLTNAEQYVYDYLFSEYKEDYSFIKFKEEMKKDILKKGLAYDKKDISFAKFYFIFYGITFIIYSIFYVKEMFEPHAMLNQSFLTQEYLTYGLIFAIIPSIPLFCFDSITHTLNLELSYRGWFYRYYIKAYKKFLKEFTNIDELELKNYPLWEKHLLYAQALNINKKHELLPDIEMGI